MLSEAKPSSSDFSIHLRENMENTHISMSSKWFEEKVDATIDVDGQ